MYFVFINEFSRGQSNIKPISAPFFTRLVYSPSNPTTYPLGVSTWSVDEITRTVDGISKGSVDENDTLPADLRT
jgi:hypothetical protein